jgi:hypothetical protein
MKKPIGLLLVSLVITQPGPVFAQDSLLEYLIDACEEDLAQYCSQVTPGEGRLLHCVAAHEDKLSGQCDYALYQAASLLEQLSVAIAYVASSCSTEIATLCSDVQAGEGQILACLEDNGDQLGNPCKKAIADTTGE